MVAREANGRGDLPTGSGGVDEPFTTDACAGIVELLCIDTVVAAVLAVAIPGDNKVTGGVHVDVRSALIARGVRVDLEFISQGRAAGVESSCKYIRVSSSVTPPSDDEVT